MTIEDKQLGELLARASEAGAQRALAHLGLADESAAKDMADLRELLSAWRDAKRSARKAVVEWLVRGALASALVALEPVGPIDALRRSTHATTGHRGWAVSVALMIAFGGYLVVQFGIGAASALGGAELIVVVVAMFVQTVTFAVPVGVVVALARRLRDPAHPVDPLPAQRRSTAVTAAAVVASHFRPSPDPPPWLPAEHSGCGVSSG